MGRLVRPAGAAEAKSPVRGFVSAAAGPGGLTEIQPLETTDPDAPLREGNIDDLSAT